jgi:hypothetical protein
MLSGIIRITAWADTIQSGGYSCDQLCCERYRALAKQRNNLRSTVEHKGRCCWFGQQKNQSLEGGSITAVIHHPLKFCKKNLRKLRKIVRRIPSAYPPQSFFHAISGFFRVFERRFAEDAFLYLPQRKQRNFGLFSGFAEVPPPKIYKSSRITQEGGLQRGLQGLFSIFFATLSEK